MLSNLIIIKSSLYARRLQSLQTNNMLKSQRSRVHQSPPHKRYRVTKLAVLAFALSFQDWKSLHVHKLQQIAPTHDKTGSPKHHVRICGCDIEAVQLCFPGGSYLGSYSKPRREVIKMRRW